MIALTLSQQIINEAKCRGNGWESAADDLTKMAVEITGSNLPAYGQNFKAICNEVFRTDGEG